MSTVEFSDQVILVTGSSRGLGAAFAHCLAAAGATVAVNSTGSDERGNAVVADIVAGGGQAVHVPGRVEDAETLVDSVVSQCGRLDAIVHNAGFIQDKTLRKMSSQQWDAVLDVHLKSAFKLSQAAWPHFEKQEGGRLVFITSVAGLYGNFGQANYAAAKMGMYGLCRSIALEGTQANIACNCVAPFGATEMNSGHMSEEMKALIRAEYVAPLVAYLAHADCPANGRLYEASAGRYKELRWQRSEGLALDTQQPLTVDDIAAGWSQIQNFDASDNPRDMREALSSMYEPGN